MEESENKPSVSRVPLECEVGRHFIQRIAHPDKIVSKKWQYKIEERDVVLMAISGKYAMVRRKGCIPYVCNITELSIIPTLEEMRKLLTPNV